MDLKDLVKDNIILSYEGRITPKMLNSFLNIIEERLKNVNESTRVLKKMYSVFVESLHNLFHHSEVKSLGKSYPVCFSIMNDENAYYIKTMNFVDQETEVKIKSKIDYVNSLNYEELRGFYVKILTDGKVSDKGGGGLGILDIARKTKNKLHYNFKKIDDSLSTFTFLITVNKDKKSDNK